MIYVHNQFSAKPLDINDNIHGWERQYIELSHKINEGIHLLFGYIPVRSRQKSPEVARSRQKSPEVARSRQKSPEVARSRQKSPEVARSRQKSPEVARSRQKSRKCFMTSV